MSASDFETEILPVLEAAYEVSKTKTGSWPFVSQREVNEALGREPFDPRTDKAIRDLGNAGYLSGVGHTDFLVGAIDFEPTEKTFRLLAGWPDPDRSAAETFLTVVQQRIDAASPDERSRLEKLRESASEVGHGILADIIAGTIRGAGGSLG